MSPLLSLMSRNSTCLIGRKRTHRRRPRLEAFENRTLPSISVGDAAAIEGASAAFTVSLDAASGSTVTVVYSTADGTAAAGSDYTAVSGTLTFAPGDTSKNVLVSTLDDVAGESPETFTLNLSNPIGDTILDGQGVGTIFDTDGPVAPPSGLMSWWTGDEDATDRVGPNDGTLINGVAIVPGKVGNAFSFDGTNYVTAGTTGLLTGNANRTMEMWVNVRAPGGDSLLAGYGLPGSATQSYQMFVDPARRVGFSQWGQAVFGPALDLGRWYHVATTTVGNSITVYVDGQAAASGSLSINTPADSEFNIGGFPGPLGDTRKFNGMVDEVSVYSRALSPGEIQGIFAAGAHGKDKGLSVTINQSATQQDPTIIPSVAFDVHFGDPVTGFDSTDVSLAGSTATGTLVATVTGSGADYTVTVMGMTSSGSVIAGIPAGAATNGAGKPSLASTSADNSVTYFDNVAPTVTIDQAPGQPDPAPGPPIVFAVHFSEPVTGFDGSDLDFTGSTESDALSATVLGSGADYTVHVSSMTGAGTVVARIPAGKVSDLSGNTNAASTSTDNTVAYVDAVPPAVTIHLAPGQPDPTNGSSVSFAVRFTEAVTGFTADDVDLGASTAGGPLVATVAGNLDRYTVTVTGMTTHGFVVASIPAGAATDAAGNASLESTGTDNSIEYLATGTIGFTRMVFDTTEEVAAHTVTITVTRTGPTEGAVSIQYHTSDGTAHSADYTETTGILEWPDGQGGVREFTIDIQPDSLNEGRELISLVLDNPVGLPGLGLTTAAVAIAPSDGQGPGTYQDQDGDKYTIKLGGKTGSLVYYRTDPDGDGRGPIERIELTGTLPDPLAPKASLAVTVAKAATTSDVGTVGLGAITGPGLKSISARKATLNGDGIDLSGYLGSLTIGNITGGADVRTLGTTNPLQKTRVSALAIGTGTTIDVAAPVSSFTATSFGAESFRAPSVGTMTIKATMSADIEITGLGVDPAKKAMTTLRVTGAVTGSDIFVNGNVGAVLVGAFRDSRLFAGYRGPDVPEVSGFNTAATIGTFRSTAAPAGFQDSRVVATTIKTVAITSLDPTNDDEKFGIYARSGLGAISVVGPTKFKYNPALPTPQGQVDFEVKLVV